jgi:hypothetical protein
MYKLNPLQQKVLITSDEVIFHAPTKQTLDPRTIQNAIIIAEQRFIRPTLGDALYEELINQKNTLVTAGNLAAMQALIGSAPILKAGDFVNATEFLTAFNLQLWKEGLLWKTTAEAVMLIALPDEFVQFRSEGVVHPHPPASVMSQSGVVTPDLRSVKWVMDKKLMDRIDPLVEAIKAYICRNKASYPLYTWCPCEDDNGAEVSRSRKTNWALGLYDDTDKTCGCDW